jgi:hypothetical protein
MVIGSRVADCSGGGSVVHRKAVSFARERARRSVVRRSGDTPPESRKTLADRQRSRTVASCADSGEADGPRETNSPHSTQRAVSTTPPLCARSGRTRRRPVAATVRGGHRPCRDGASGISPEPRGGILAKSEHAGRRPGSSPGYLACTRICMSLYTRPPTTPGELPSGPCASACTAGSAAAGRTASQQPPAPRQMMRTCTELAREVAPARSCTVPTVRLLPWIAS